MRQDDTRRLLITITELLALVLATLAIAMWRWPERIRGMIFGAAPGNPPGTWDGWGWLALGWFALVGSWLLLVVVAALLLPAVDKSSGPAATEPSRARTREIKHVGPRQRPVGEAERTRAER